MYVKVVVTPDVRRERVTKVSDTEFHIETSEPAARNRANTRVRELIAREYGVPVGQVRLLTGHRSRGKIVSVEV